MKIKESLEVHKEAEPSFLAALDVQRRDRLFQMPGKKGGTLDPAANDSQSL